MMKRKVLVVSNPDDEHTRRVAGKIAEFGAEPILFFPEDLGEDVGLSLKFSPEGEVQPALSLSTEQLDLEAISAVWYRRPRLAALNHYSLTPEGVAFARDEWRASLEATYMVMERPLWVSHPDCLRRAARKPFQLALACRLGFTVPQTLITSDPEEAAAFIESCQGRVIVKATGSGWVFSEHESEITYVLTNRLNEADLHALKDIEIAPVTLQEEIPKAYEIRANVVGQELLAIRIESQRSPISQVDWRRYDVANTPYTPYQLPPDLEQKSLKLTRMLGLEFGAIDLIRRPDGEYVFLEINGNGQFLWAEELSGVQVSASLARLLSGIAPPLQSAHF